MPSILLYLVYHDESSRKVAEKYMSYPWARLLYIPSTKYLESIAYHMVKDLEHEWRDKEYVGVLKYSFEGKTPFYDFEAICAQDSYDLFTFVGPDHHAPSTQHLSMIQNAVSYHPLFSTIWAHLLIACCRIDGSDAFSNEIPAFYSNYWIARTLYFKEYLAFFETVYQLMETDPNIKPLLEQDSCYSERHISEEKLQQIMGAPFYKYYPFLMERLPCFFFWKVGAHIHAVSPEEQPSLLE